ncbi:hypothetical protein [Streptosporangium sp. 'caverna']|uniref:hypothetical protein n=1 Tax=Streptosporangium sp. 'caverna' TaxID=2202249 RepID=UPI0019551908|nr:hypothetical protein [Streptosporangium sp. 'caverna']
MTGIAREVRLSFPETRLVRQDVPFPALTRCLPEHQVDVLWTPAPVRYSAVDSFPLAMTSARIGVVATRHTLADADTMNVEDFSEHPILYNPAAADEWMTRFWLGDVRPRREARPVETDAGNLTCVLRHTAESAAVIATLAEIAPFLDSRLRMVTLTGVAPYGLPCCIPAHGPAWRCSCPRESLPGSRPPPAIGARCDARFLRLGTRSRLRAVGDAAAARTLPGNAAALLSVEAVAVWQAHLAARETERERNAQVSALSEWLSVGSPVAACPSCRSSFMHLVFTGQVVIALVNTADPAVGAQAVVADSDVTAAE